MTPGWRISSFIGFPLPSPDLPRARDSACRREQLRQAVLLTFFSFEIPRGRGGVHHTNPDNSFTPACSRQVPQSLKWIASFLLLNIVTCLLVRLNSAALLSLTPGRFGESCYSQFVPGCAEKMAGYVVVLTPRVSLSWGKAQLKRSAMHQVADEMTM